MNHNCPRRKILKMTAVGSTTGLLGGCLGTEGDTGDDDGDTGDDEEDATEPNQEGDNGETELEIRYRVDKVDAFKNSGDSHSEVFIDESLDVLDEGIGLSGYTFHVVDNFVLVSSEFTNKTDEVMDLEGPRFEIGCDGPPSDCTMWFPQEASDRIWGIDPGDSVTTWAHTYDVPYPETIDVKLPGEHVDPVTELHEDDSIEMAEGVLDVDEVEALVDEVIGD